MEIENPRKKRTRKIILFITPSSKKYKIHNTSTPNPEYNNSRRKNTNTTTPLIFDSSMNNRFPAQKTVNSEATEYDFRGERKGT